LSLITAPSAKQQDPDIPKCALLRVVPSLEQVLREFRARCVGVSSEVARDGELALQQLMEARLGQVERDNQVRNKKGYAMSLFRVPPRYKAAHHARGPPRETFTKAERRRWAWVCRQALMLRAQEADQLALRAAEQAERNKQLRKAVGAGTG
jgi:hypothetical protein